MIFKYASAIEYTVSNLKSRNLYCRHFSDYNDPFEFWWKLEEGLPDLDDSNERVQRAITAWGFPDTKKQDLPADDDFIRDYLRALAETPFISLDKIRISCFSQSADNLLMWSRYADNLRGVCLEFDEQAILNEDDNHFLVRVKYTGKPPVVDTLVYAITEDVFNYSVEHGYDEEKLRNELNELIRTAIESKPVEWRYENEVRLVIGNQNDGKKPVLYKYPDESLRGIIIGERISNDFKEQMLLLAKELNISIKTAKRSKDSFRIEIVNADNI